MYLNSTVLKKLREHSCLIMIHHQISNIATLGSVSVWACSGRIHWTHEIHPDVFSESCLISGVPNDMELKRTIL